MCVESCDGGSAVYGFMPADKENDIGAKEHQKIRKQYGFYEDAALQAYVNKVGAKVTQDTERPDVHYKFFILDSPIVNAFALPGGYIYVSRGLLALANNEAELAGVLAHETGHITARHSAERYSHGVVTSLGSSVLSAVIGNDIASQALGVGTNLYLSGYSRSQENEADALGLRYMSHGGYNPEAMSAFLTSLDQEKQLSLQGDKDPASSYFSTHPPTPERIEKTSQAASMYAGTDLGKNRYLEAIDGLVYGDSAQQGYVYNGRFYHSALNFSFIVPKTYELINQKDKVVLKAENDRSLAIFDFAHTDDGLAAQDAETYLRYVWMKDEKLPNVQSLTVHGEKAAEAHFEGRVNGKPMHIRLIAVPWGNGDYARFQIAYSKDANEHEVDILRAVGISLRPIAKNERATIHPAHVEIVTAHAGDHIDLLAKKQIFEQKALEHFRVLNGLGPHEDLVAGQKYKLIVQ